MKACENYIDMILESVDGALSESAEQALQEHLSSCEGCCVLYESYLNIQNGILDMEEEVPEGLSGAVMGAIRQEKEKSSPIYYLRCAKFTLVAVAACLVIVVAGKFVDFSSAATESVVSDNATVEIRMMDAAPETEEAQEAPMPLDEGAALIPAYDEEAEETVEFATEEAAVEAPVEAAEADDEFGVAQEENSISAMKKVLSGLELDGYSGDLVELLGMREIKLMELFPQAETLELSTGDVVYRIAREDLNTVVGDLFIGNVVSTDSVGEDAFLWLN